MNKMKSLYILLGLFVILIFIEIALYYSKKDLEITYYELQQHKKMVSVLKEFRSKYSLEHMKKLQNILQSNHFLSAKFNINLKSNSMKIQAEDLTIKDLNYLFSKLFNDHYPITKFEVVQRSATTVQLVMELKW